MLQKFLIGGGVVMSLLVLVPGAKLRGIVFAGCLLAAFLVWLFNKGILKARKVKASAFDRGLQADANKPTKGKAESRKAVSELAERWNKAIAQLKSSGLSLYDLPWYMLIGEPQSGKSTTLKQSGLEFPVGTEALSGAGGTRNCDWWFTNEAIILDTAGRFTFQEKNAPDAEEWNGFLHMIKKNRPACPINGIIMTIPCTSLLSDEPEVREEKARNIREKLTQIQKELGVQFPVFILLTKADQVLGFTEFFSRLGATEQRQLVGWSMPGPFIQAYNPDSFNEIFPKMYDRIHKWRLKLLGEDLSLTDVDKMYVFPEEFLALREPLHDYLKTIFVKTHYLAPLFFRGFYFTSGLQQGKPVAKACAAMIRNAGAGAEEIVEHLQKIFERSRAFFIRDFYLEKLFPERSMVIHSEGAVKRDRKLGIASVWASAILLVLTLGFVGWRAMDMRKGIGKIDDVAKKVYTTFSDDLARIKKGDTSAHSTEEAASSVKLAAEFEKDSADTLQSLPGLALPLQDMYWVYYIQNVLQDQGRALYGKIEKTPAGASISDAAVGAEYATYAKMWSISDAWLDHTSSNADFGYSEQVAWPQMLQTGVTPETQKQFQSGLEKLRGVIKQDLDFKSQPAALALVPGHQLPTQNTAIRKEVEFVSGNFKPVDAATVQAIVNAATGLRNTYGQSIGGVLGISCGYADPTADPFSTARTAIAGIRASFGGLDKIMEENKTLLLSMGADPNSIMSAFGQLGWANATVPGSAQTALISYVKGKATDIATRMQSEAAAARLPLQSVTDVVITSGTLVRSPVLGYVDQGLRRMEALADAQNAFIKKIAASTDIKNTDALKQVSDLWLQDKARGAAKEWADAFAARTDIPPAWQVPQLALVMQKMVKDGDESTRVEAWLAYAKAVMPGTLLSSNQIAEATLTVDPPSGAQPDRVTKATADLQGLIDSLTKFKGEVTCDKSLARLGTKITDVASVQKQNQTNFLAYWKSGYNRWDPSAWINGISTWEAFKAEPLLQGATLSMRVKGDLARFVSNVGGYKEKGGSVGDLSQPLADLSQFVSPGSVLEQNANQFSDTISEMDKNMLTAKTQLAQNGANGQLRDKTIDLIATRSSSLNSKFDYYPKKVRALLAGAQKEFENELDRFLTRWSKDLAGKFPFAVDTAAIKTTDNEVVIPQATAKLLRDFYYGPESLPVYLTKYETLYKEWVVIPENKPAQDFFNDCLKLRDFLFTDATKGEFRPLSVEGTYTGFDGKKAEDLREISERLDFTMPSAAPQPVTGRWRSQVPGSSSTFAWTPGDYGANKMTFKSSLERGDNPNTAQVTVGGDFAPLAYIVTQSVAPEAESRKFTSKFGVVPPNNKQRYLVNFVFTIDRSMPKMPDWSVMKKWMK